MSAILTGNQGTLSEDNGADSSLHDLQASTSVLAHLCIVVLHSWHLEAGTFGTTAEETDYFLHSVWIRILSAFDHLSVIQI